MKPIKVMIVDDSAMVRQGIRKKLEADPAIRVIGAAADPVRALEHMKREWPDVIVLDVERPHADGLAVLRHIMSERPTPVVACSSLAEHEANAAIRALGASAAGLVTQPRTGLKDFLEDASTELATAVKAAARSRAHRRSGGAGQGRVAAVTPKLGADAVLSLAGLGSGADRSHPTERIVAIGTSTGGTQALESVLTRLPATCPGIVVVQHMPERFTAMFAERLDAACRIEVREACNGDRVMPGRALIAPGGKHMVLARSGTHYTVRVIDGPLVNRHRPSVDVLFRSCAMFAGPNAVGIIMTGMGDDGAKGLLEMAQAGAYTIAEDEASCIVFGMPKEAIKLGAVRAVLPLEAIPKAILEAAGHAEA